MHLTTRVAVLLIVLTTGCASAPNREQWITSFRTAANDPDTWVPAAGAILAATADQEISDWARDQTPLFGSARNADRWSDHLKGGTQILMIATALTLDDPTNPWRTRGLRLLEQELIVRGVGEITGVSKNAANRERPDKSDRNSFPSGHASVSSARRSLTESNLARSRLDDRRRRAIAVTARVAAIGTSWARIEAGQHYPSDVLAGAALGNFVARFVDELFDRRAPFAARVEISPRKIVILIGLR